MSDESILGLLLRAHGAVAGQAHGEEYVFHNISASSHYKNAQKSIEDAIRSVGFADIFVARQEDRKGKQ